MRAYLLGILALWSLAARAQQTIPPFQPPLLGWLSCPCASSRQAVWFRRTYLGRRRPLQGRIAIAATGRIQIYVNEANVSPQIAATDTHSPYTATIDITPYLRSDSNTIAILYAPFAQASSHRKIAVCYYGRGRDGKPFAHDSDGSWLCRPAHFDIDADGVCHAQTPACDHTFTQDIALTQWTGAEPCTPTAEGNPLVCPSPTVWLRPAKILRPRYFDLTPNGIEYEFGTGFYGHIRITLRGTRRGEHIMVGSHELVCSGQTDEQLCTLLAPVYYRRVLISGDAHFTPSQIQSIEGVAMEQATPITPYKSH